MMSDRAQLGSFELEDDKLNLIDMEDDMEEAISDQMELDISTEKKRKSGLGAHALEAYTYNSVLIKEKVDNMAAEIEQRQGKIKLLHEILQAINKLSNENGLDISEQIELQEKLKIAKELGVDIPEDQRTFNTQQRDFLKESLCMAADDFNNENKLQTQKMHVHSQESDRWLTIANTFIKGEERIKKHIRDNK
ncbi:MAG: hypothetical protein ACHQUC_02050 [Chlamydiales bacterium]